MLIISILTSDGFFDPKTTKGLTAAFDTAWHMLRTSVATPTMGVMRFIGSECGRSGSRVTQRRCRRAPQARFTAPHFCPCLPLESQRRARDTQGCSAMTKDPTRPDDPEMDDLLRQLHLFGQAPSREYIAAVFSGQGVTQTRDRSERPSAPASGKRRFFGRKRHVRNDQ